MYLMDTDVLSNLLRPAPSTALVAKLASVPPDQQFTSSITLGELIYGAHLLRERGRSLRLRLEEILPPHPRVLPFDGPAARRYGELRADLEQRGLPIGGADLRIAAVALVNNLTVVTQNIRHFERVPGLIVENWIE